MTGRGVDQILPHPSAPLLYESYVTSALDYVALAEQTHGAIARPVEFAYVWGEALGILERVRPDARILNLETSVTRSDDADPKGINYRMHPANLPVLTVARVDCCSLANNHVLDWGVDGLVETLSTLEGAGIQVAGAGRDIDAAQSPAVLNARGVRLLVFAFGAPDCGIPSRWCAGPERPGVHLLADLDNTTIDRVGRLVEGAKGVGDIAVASIHWGPNWGYEIPVAHRRFAHALIDRCAIDVVYGHSSHHPKAIEVYHERPIFYGCGDFVNDHEGISGYEQLRPDLVLMYFPMLDASARLTSLSMIPLRSSGFALRLPCEEDREWLRARMDRECQRFRHRVTRRGEGFALRWPDESREE
jgi:poly-gamma-glutamate synthesis protein (capsule biosynthesis protein)